LAAMRVKELAQALESYPSVSRSSEQEQFAE
jgi:hypothetical protein